MRDVCQSHYSTMSRCVANYEDTTIKAGKWKNRPRAVEAKEKFFSRFCCHAEGVGAECADYQHRRFGDFFPLPTFTHVCGSAGRKHLTCCLLLSTEILVFVCRVFRLHGNYAPPLKLKKLLKSFPVKSEENCSKQLTTTSALLFSLSFPARRNFHGSESTKKQQENPRQIIQRVSR